MDFSEADLCALKSRFRMSVTNGKLLIHCLPNNLVVITFNPSYIKTCKSIQMPNFQISNQSEIGELLCKTDKDEIKMPLVGEIIDVNDNVKNELKRFQTGPTSTFLIILKPAKFNETIPAEFKPVQY